MSSKSPSSVKALTLQELIKISRGELIIWEFGLRDYVIVGKVIGLVGLLAVYVGMVAVAVVTADAQEKVVFEKRGG